MLKEFLIQYLQKNRSDGSPAPDLLDLIHSRIVIAEETFSENKVGYGGSSSTISASLVKSITGGDTITARTLHNRRMITFQPRCIPILFGNAPIRIKDKSVGIQDRIKNIPMRYTYKDNADMNKIIDGFKKEGSAILRRIVNAVIEWKANGMKMIIPKIVKEESEKMFIEQDIIFSFVKDCCIIDSKQKVKGTDLFMSYTKYCDNESIKYVDMVDRKEFYGRIRMLNNVTETNIQSKKFIGIGLKEESAEKNIRDRSLPV